MRLVQTHLVQNYDGGTSHMIVWLDIHPKVKCGTFITLDKNLSDWWRVEEQFAVTDSESIQRKWGLSLPKSQRTEL